tara:strand:+ start:191045 stop:191440 length:396 start_codon:yes stop_codon:yes gene_type:complete
MRITLLLLIALTGCKYYGSALPPDYPLSMDVSLDVARDKALGAGGVERQLIRHTARPDMSRPSYIPEKELAVVAPPKTLLVWTYPHVTADNTRVFGNWSTIFLTDRYEWVLPVNDRSMDENAFGAGYGVTQ